MSWRARFGRRSMVPAAAGIVFLALGCAAFYLGCAWAISMVWPRLTPSVRTATGAPILCIRGSDGSERFVHESDPGFESLMRVSLEDPTQKVSVVPRLRVEVLEPSALASSSSRERATLLFERGLRFDGAPLDAGWPLRDDEREALLGVLRADRAGWLPAQLRASAGFAATRPLPQGVMHNSLRAAAMAVALLAGAGGVLAVVRGERRHRRRSATCCPHCGYSLIGLPITGVCPECGHEH